MAWWNAKKLLESNQSPIQSNTIQSSSRADNMIDSLIKLETYRSMVIDNHRKQAGTDDTLKDIRDLLTQQVDAPEEGGGTADAMMLTLLTKVMAGGSSTVQPSPHPEVAAVKEQVDVEQTAAHIVDVVKQQWPKVLKQIRDGKISKAQALALMQAQGVRLDVAQRAYELAVEGVA